MVVRGSRQRNSCTLAQLHKTVASLRIMGDALDPDEISQVLSCAPTAAFRKGQVVRGVVTGREVVKKSGMWTLGADDQQPGNLDEQIRSIFSRLPDDLEIWRDLSSKYRMDLFCGFFMEVSDEGLEISPDSLRLLGERLVPLDFCIYAPTGVKE
jgi:hypothetical protein